MTHINLATQKEEGVVLEKGTVILLASSLLIVFVYFGLVFLGKKIDSDVKNLIAEYDAKQANFVAGETAKVLDFQNRLVLSEELLAKKNTGMQDLEKVEEAIIPGVYLGSYEFDESSKTISLKCYTSNYGIVAKQLLSFKSSEHFSSVLSGESSFDITDNRIIFPIVLTIK